MSVSHRNSVYLFQLINFQLSSLNMESYFYTVNDLSYVRIETLLIVALRWEFFFMRDRGLFFCQFISGSALGIFANGNALVTKKHSYFDLRNKMSILLIIWTQLSHYSPRYMIFHWYGITCGHGTLYWHNRRKNGYRQSAYTGIYWTISSLVRVE